MTVHATIPRRPFLNDITRYVGSLIVTVLLAALVVSVIATR